LTIAISARTLLPEADKNVYEEAVAMSTIHHCTRRRFLCQAGSFGAAALATPPLLASSAAAPPGPSGQWQIGCFTRPWAQYDYRVALDAIAEAGFQYAGLMSAKGQKSNLVVSLAHTPEEVAQIAVEVKKRGLKVPAIWGDEFLVGPSLQAARDKFKKLIDYCALVESPALMLGGTYNVKTYDEYYKLVAEVCPYAAERRVELVAKPHGVLNTTGPEIRKNIELVGQKNFTLWYDPGNILFYSKGKVNPVQDAASVAGLVTGMCVKDLVISEKDGKQVMDGNVTPGTGQVDFRALMAVLKQGGFTGGPLVVECLAPGDMPALLSEAKKARQFVEALVA